MIRIEEIEEVLTYAKHHVNRAYHLVERVPLDEAENIIGLVMELGDTVDAVMEQDLGNPFYRVLEIHPSGALREGATARTFEEADEAGQNCGTDFMIMRFEDEKVYDVDEDRWISIDLMLHLMMEGH